MFEPLFLLPALNGLCFAILLPLLGCYLRLRGEWLAALSYPHVAAAGALGAMALGAPPAAGGMASAGAAALVKHGAREQAVRTASFGLLLLLGWSASTLLTSNLPLAERLGHALFDGQLYFTGTAQLSLSFACLLIGLALLRLFSRRLLLAQIFPQLAHRRVVGERSLELGLDLTAAVVLALATMTIGVMAAFALIFVPAWVAFRRAGNWRAALLWSVLLSGTAYAGAFSIALRLDQPFGSMLALVAVLLSTVGLLPRNVAQKQSLC